jgi:hypothetical protein
MHIPLEVSDVISVVGEGHFARDCLSKTRSNYSKKFTQSTDREKKLEIFPKKIGSKGTLKKQEN